LFSAATEEVGYASLTDARPDLVQCIKLCEHIMGRGTALTRLPEVGLKAA
jgi:hypothetical protein